MKKARRYVPAAAGLPGYELRRNARARRVVLRISPAGELTVTAPQRTSLSRVAEVVASRREWIEATLAEVARQNEREGRGGPHELPAELLLRTARERWRVSYVARPGSGVSLRRNADFRLLVSGEVCPEAVRSALVKFVTARARLVLPELLREQALCHGVSYGRVQVRAQRTRWASCSARRTLSLNYKLVFLPPELTRYVLVHELAHLTHLNHSTDFRELVAEMEPRAERLEAELNAARRFVPTFFDVS